MKRGAVTMSLIITIFFAIGCATANKTIAAGMLTGAVVGAGVGYQFVHHGERRQFETQNTVITSILFSMVTGAVLAWHYREVERAQVEISGRYARYRLCNPDELPEGLARELDINSDKNIGSLVLQPEQIGRHAISLDDTTKWAFPTFRKRFLAPDRGENQVLSGRYIWEIIRPGNFVTRSQNPEFFVSGEEGKK